MIIINHQSINQSVIEYLKYEVISCAVIKCIIAFPKLFGIRSTHIHSLAHSLNHHSHTMITNLSYQMHFNICNISDSLRQMQFRIMRQDVIIFNQSIIYSFTILINVQSFNWTFSHYSWVKGLNILYEFLITGFSHSITHVLYINIMDIYLSLTIILSFSIHVVHH